MDHKTRLAALHRLQLRLRRGGVFSPCFLHNVRPTLRFSRGGRVPTFPVGCEPDAHRRLQAHVSLRTHRPAAHAPPTNAITATKKTLPLNTSVVPSHDSRAL